MTAQTESSAALRQDRQRAISELLVARQNAATVLVTPTPAGVGTKPSSSWAFEASSQAAESACSNSKRSSMTSRAARRSPHRCKSSIARWRCSRFRQVAETVKEVKKHLSLSDGMEQLGIFPTELSPEVIRVVCWPMRLSSASTPSSARSPSRCATPRPRIYPALVELRDQFAHRLPDAEFQANDLLDELIAKTTERGSPSADRPERT